MGKNNKGKNSKGKNNNQKNGIGKKIILTLVLVLIVGAIIFVAVNASSGKKEVKVQNTAITQKTSDKKVTSGPVTNTSTNKAKKKTTIKELKDGTLYTLTDEDVKADIVIGDNYYDTQLADINTNFNQYDGKTIEIEGFYLYNNPYTFIGRYSETNLCAYCPVGYSYFEYEWHGDYDFNFTEEREWLKIKGTLKKGNDGVDYYYIDVLSLEVMNEKGQDTVKN